MRWGFNLLLDGALRSGGAGLEALSSTYAYFLTSLPIVAADLSVTVPLYGGIFIDPKTFGRVDAAVPIPISLDGFIINQVNNPQLTCIPSGVLCICEVDLIGFALEYSLAYTMAVQNQVKLDLIIAASHRWYLGINGDVYAGVITDDYFYL
jgi:hypothetical protein